MPLAYVKYTKLAIVNVAFAWWLGIAAPCAKAQAQATVPTQAAAARDSAERRNLQVQVATGSSSTQSGSAVRVALVIGNAAYPGAALANPVNDARAVAQALREAGFSVITRENTDQRGLLSALREFGDRLQASGAKGSSRAVGLFYFAGHGMQIKGRNYLIPVGSVIEREDEVAYSAVDAQAVLDKMEAAGNVANIMILDACRNNPFTRSMRSGQVGLAQMDAPAGTLLAYATAPGSVASDGTGTHGLYTQHLLGAMRQPGAKVEDVFKQVRVNVRRDSQGKQVPWEATSLEGDFYFTGGPAVAVRHAADAAPEAALWNSVKGSSLPVEIGVYLKNYPNGKFAAEARARLAQLQGGGAIAANGGGTGTGAGAGRTKPAPAQAAAAAAAAPEAVPRPPAGNAGNSFGHTPGDRWRYQTVDKFKQEVVRNWSRKIDSVQADGSLTLNGGRVGWSAAGAVSALRGPGGFSRDYSPAFQWRPATLVAGHSEPLTYHMAWRKTDGSRGVEDRVGTVKVLARESIKVPAGEFDAWKIEYAGFLKGKNLGQSASYSARFKEIYWYVPALRNFVASEYEERASNLQIQAFERHELTSFSVRGAGHLAQR